MYIGLGKISNFIKYSITNLSISHLPINNYILGMSISSIQGRKLALFRNEGSNYCDYDFGYLLIHNFLAQGVKFEDLFKENNDPFVSEQSYFLKKFYDHGGAMALSLTLGRLGWDIDDEDVQKGIKVNTDSDFCKQITNDIHNIEHFIITKNS